MTLILNCGCGKRLQAKQEWAGKRVKCPQCATLLTVPAAAAPVAAPAAPAAVLPVEEPPAPDRPPRRPRPKRDPGAHRLTRFPVGLVILFNCLTLGLFSSIRFNLMHGQMPKLRRDDPSAAQGFWFLLIPFYNLYWFFFTYLRLVTRINEQRALRGLPPSNLRWLVVLSCVLTIVSTVIFMFVIPGGGLFINPVSLVVWCVLFSVIQGRVNELVEASEFVPVREGEMTCPECGEEVHVASPACRSCGYAFPGAGASEGDAPAVEVRRVMARNRRGLCLTWGWLLTVLGLAVLGLIILGLAVGEERPDPRSPELLGVLLGTTVLTAPFLVPGVICLFRARNYRLELGRLEEEGEASDLPPADRDSRPQARRRT